MNLKPKKVNTLIPEIAKLINYPEETVQVVMDSFFKALKNDISSLNFGQLNFEYFGKVRAHSSGVYSYFKAQLAKARENPDPTTIERMLKARKLYHQAREIKKLRQFKERWQFKNNFHTSRKTEA